MHPGTFIAYAGTIGKPLAATITQGKGPEHSSFKGKADASTTIYREQINTVDNGRLTGFINRAAAALSVAKWNLVIEDSHGRKQKGWSVEGGTNNGASPVENN